MDGEHTPRTPEPADLSKLLRGIRGDEALLGRLIDNFLADCPARLGALRRALDAGNAPAVDHAAHGLRGSLLLLGADEAAARALEVEALGRAGNLPEVEEALSRLEAEVTRLSEFLARRRLTTP